MCVPPPSSDLRFKAIIVTLMQTGVHPRGQLDGATKDRRGLDHSGGKQSDQVWVNIVNRTKVGTFNTGCE